MRTWFNHMRGHTPDHWAGADTFRYAEVGYFSDGCLIEMQRLRDPAVTKNRHGPPLADHA